MKKIIITAGLIFAFSSAVQSQTLWNIDVQDVDAAKSWTYEEGIYNNTSDATAAGFTGINYVPEAGFVFYIENATIMDYHAVYNELVAKFGKEDLNKDHIDPTLPYSPNHISAPVHEESINRGGTFVYREWNEDQTKIRFFWNQFRFWIEAVKK